ncbi:hypothetical protein AGMMS49965_21920 [Bacteroidia bacterium]|nr:hypothetical protein AGMMS49965_21920 [Bacteroidia bacterium]
MKQSIITASAILFIVVWNVSCHKTDGETETSGEVIDIFELKYGEEKIISRNNQSFSLVLTDIQDSVTVDCSLADFIDASGPEKIRHHALIAVKEIKNENTLITVSSKPCGALYFENDGTDIQHIRDILSSITATPAGESYYQQEFLALFGNGVVIPNAALRINMAKAYPNIYQIAEKEHDEVEKEHYKFIFIISTLKN